MSENPQIQAVEDSWSIPGGAPTVDALRVPANEHAAEMLVVFLPESGILFQGDLIRFPINPEEPFRPHTTALLDLIEERNLAVESIAGVHGEAGDVPTLREWIERNRE